MRECVTYTRGSHVPLQLVSYRLDCLGSGEWNNNYYYYNIYLTISILNGQEPPVYFENSRGFVDKHDYSIICYPIISADYTVRSAQCASLAKARES